MKSFRIECGFGIGLLGAKIIQSIEIKNNKWKLKAISKNFVNFLISNNCLNNKKKQNPAKNMYFLELYLIWNLKINAKTKTKLKGKVHVNMLAVTWCILINILFISAGLVEVIIYSSPDDKKKNRGFCFLEYESHKAASLAKRRLGTGRIKVCAHILSLST